MNYGFIYETTNLVNGKKYIGSHKRTQDIEDPDDSWYLGSGKLLWRAIHKYGIENFSRRILCDCCTQEELEAAETKILLETNAAKDPNYYNLMPSYFGGTSGGVNSPMYGKHHSEETKKLIGIRSGATRKGKPLSSEHRKRISKSLIGAGSGSPNGSVAIHKEDVEKRVLPEVLDDYLENGWSPGRLPQNRLTNPNLPGYWEGRKQSEESIQKRVQSLKNRIAITKDGDVKRIQPEELDKYLAEGWVKGMPESFSEMRSNDVKGKVHIHKGEEQKFIYPDELDKYLAEGWVKGLPEAHRKNLSESKLGDKNPAKRDDVREKIRKANLGKIWVQNGIEKVFIHKEELDKYVTLGYVRGKKIVPLGTQ